LNELEVWERTYGRQILQSMNTTAGSTEVMSKDFNGEGWMKRSKIDFEQLVRRAREKGSSAKKAETENETSEATEPSSEA
jgi:hypothetical protein